MTSATKEENNSTPPPAKKKGMGGFVIFIGFIILGFILYKFSSIQNNALNQEFYRVLYEVSVKFNRSLYNLQRTHKGSSNLSAIHSFLPSYKKLSKELCSSEETKNKKITYQLQGKKISIRCKNSKNKEIEYAELPLQSIMPETSHGFSQYLLVNANSKVITSIGKDNRTSIVDMSSIQAALEKSKNGSLLNFSRRTAQKEAELKGSSSDKLLPSMSIDIDLSLSSGDFRVFIFPFSLNIDLLDSDASPKKNLQHLYLVGLLPKQRLATSGTGYWDISLLIVTVACLLFCWVILRLYLLPKNHAVTRMHRYSIQLISYFFFIVLVGLVLAHLQKSIFEADKDDKAQAYLHEINKDLANEINSVFKTLEGYREFYQSIYSSLSTDKRAKESITFVIDDKPINSMLINTRETSVVNSTKVETAKKGEDKDKFIVNISGQEQNTILNAFDKPKNENKAATFFNQGYRQFCQAIYSSSSSENTLKENINFVFDNKFRLNINASSEELNTILNAFDKPKNENKAATFFHDNLTIDDKSDTFKSYFTVNNLKKNKVIANGLLSVFTLNSRGITTMPSITFKEISSLPTADDLAHRDYYQLVRDGKGSEIHISKEKSFKNVHIQRLLNIGDGSKGTTISMPMCGEGECKELEELKGYVIGADVFFKSLSLSKPKSSDYTFMVVDRNSGDVLFHNNEDRSMVENLFYASHGESSIEHWIKAGFDKTIKSSPIISGFYHGKKGHFFIKASAFDKWSIIVFYPNDSLDTLMTNEFLYVVICFIIIITSILVPLSLINLLIEKTTLLGDKQTNNDLRVKLARVVSFLKLEKIDKSRLKVWAKKFSIYFASGYMVFFVINQPYSSPIGYQPECLLVIITIIALGFIIKEISQRESDDRNIRLRNSLLLVCLLHMMYFYATAQLPVNNLNAYYRNYQCSQINLEREEMNQIALMLFPNTMTQHQGDAEKLLDVENLKACRHYSSEVTPNDLPSLSTLEGAKYFWRWAKMYLFYQKESFVISADGNNYSNIEKPLINFNLSIIFWYLFFFTLLILGWEYFQRKILIGRVYCEESFLKHIENLLEKRKVKSDQPVSANERLIVDMRMKKSGNDLIGGNDINWLLQFDGTKNIGDNTRDDFYELYQLCPYLEKLKQDNDSLPSLFLKITREDSKSNKLSVSLSEIETCLHSDKTRELLLGLIRDLKSLVDSNVLKKLTINTEFNALQLVETKALLPENSLHNLNETEYLDWSECLKDFKMIVSSDITSSLDRKLLDKELMYFPELNYLKENYSEDHDEKLGASAYWSTLHYIHICAEALYRFKWELSSNEEKLALFNLSNGHRLNPRNTQIIEKLATNGLIKVKDDHLEIINESFASFVKNAESLETLNSIVKSAEQGLWRDYKLPFMLIIVTVIGGVALTSGESIYIILGSLTAILSTVVGFANSASMIKGHLK